MTSGMRTNVSRICDYEVVPSHVSSACPRLWDNLTCWQPARIGEVVEVNCPELFSQFISEEDYGETLMTLLK